MSNPWVIAAVTAVLKKALSDQLDAAAAGNVINAPNAPVVSALPPELITAGEDCRLNLFLYEITANEALSNDRLPLRNSAGSLTAVPHLVLNLRYLLSAYPRTDLQSEILIAHGLQAFSKSAIIPRAFIRAALDPAADHGASPPPAAFWERALALAEQFEQIKVTPVWLKHDEMSKIWAGLQSPYRLCVVLEVTAVLIEEETAVSTAPPVLRRGAAGTGWESLASMLPNAPTLLAVRAPGGQPAAAAGGTLQFIGHHLSGADLSITFRYERLGLAFIVTGGALSTAPASFTEAELRAAPELRTATEIITADLSMAEDESGNPAAWAAGIYTVEASVTLPGASGESVSNALTAAIAPAFALQGETGEPSAAVNGGEIAITLTCEPPLRARQTAVLTVAAKECRRCHWPQTTPHPPSPACSPPTCAAPHSASVCAWTAWTHSSSTAPACRRSLPPVTAPTYPHELRRRHSPGSPARPTAARAGTYRRHAAAAGGRGLSAAGCAGESFPSHRL
jgi:Pvc16 N-terminal domain